MKWGGAISPKVLQAVERVLDEGGGGADAAGGQRLYGYEPLPPALNARLPAHAALLGLRRTRVAVCGSNWFNTEPRAYPPGGFPSAFNSGSPIDPSIEPLLSQFHTRTVRGVPKRHCSSDVPVRVFWTRDVVSQRAGGGGDGRAGGDGYDGGGG